MSETQAADAEIKEDAEAKEKEKKKIQYPPIREVYETKSGESLIEIAFKNDLLLKTLLNHPENKHLNEENIDPENTAEKVIVNIPEQGKSFFSDPNGPFSLQISNKRAWFAVKLKLLKGGYLTGIKYLFRVYRQDVLSEDKAGSTDKLDIVIEGDSLDNGLIEFEIPFNTKSGELTIWPYGDYSKSRPLHYFVELKSNDEEGSVVRDRVNSKNNGLIPLAPYKNEKLSEVANDLLNHPEKIIPAENYVPDNYKGCLQLNVLKKHYEEELSKLDEQLKQEEKNKSNEVYALRKRKMDLAFSYLLIHKQLEHLEKTVDDLRNYFNEAPVHKDFIETLKFNDLLREILFEASENRRTKDMAEKLYKIIPVDDYHFEMLGGENVFNRELKKEKQRLEKSTNKLKKPNDKKGVIEDWKGDAELKIKLLEYQLEIHRQNKKERNKLISLGLTTNDKNDHHTISLLIKNHIQFGAAWENIVHSHINRDKPYETIKTGIEIFIHMQTLELIWGDQQSGASPDSKFQIPGFTDYICVSKKALITRFDKAPSKSKFEKITTVMVPDLPLMLYFQYADSIGGYVKNSTILYWAYDGDNKNKLAPKPKNSPVMYPAGIGMTDFRGQLIKSPDSYAIESMFHAARELKEVKNRLYYITNPMQENPDDTENDQNELSLARPIKIFDHDEENRISFKPSDKDTSKEVKKQNASNIMDGKYHRASMNYFSPHTSYGFFLYPAYHGAFQTKSVFDLDKLENGVIQSGKISEMKDSGSYSYNNLRFIKIHCTLPQWELRIKEQISQVLNSIETFEMVKLPHYQNIHILSEMQDLVTINSDYPFWAQNEDTVKNKNEMLESLQYLENAMIQNMEYPEKTEEPFGFRFRKEEIKKQAKRLSGILNCAEFQSELKKYFKHITNTDLIDSIKPGDLFPPGPYMEDESNWATIFETIAEAYSLLSKAELSYQAFERQDIYKDFKACLLEACSDAYLKDILDISDRTTEKATPVSSAINPPASPLYSQIDTLVTSLKPLTIDDCTSLSSIVVKGFNDYMDTMDAGISPVEGGQAIKGLLGLVTSTPGPSCVLQDLLNMFQRLVTLDIVDGAFGKNMHIALPALVMKTFCLSGKKGDHDAKKTCQDALITTLEQPKSRSGDASAIKVFLKNNFTLKKIDANSNPTTKTLPDDTFYAKIGSVCPAATAMYRTAFTTMNVACLLYDVIYTDNTLLPAEEKIQRSIATWSNAALQAHSVVFLNDYYKKAAGKQVTKGLKSAASQAIANSLGVVLSGISACMLWSEAEKLARNNEEFTKVLSLRLKAGVNATRAAGYGLSVISRLSIKALRMVGRELGILTIAGTTGNLLMLGASAVELIVFSYENREILNHMIKNPDAFKKAVKYGVFQWHNGKTSLTINILWQNFCASKKFMYKKVVPDRVDYTKTLYECWTEPKNEYLGTEWGIKSAEMVKRIEELSHTYFVHLGWSDTSFKSFMQIVDKGVSWSPCSWHAVIPLHLLDFPVDYIADLIMIPAFTDIKSPEKDKYRYIDSVEKIIAYYDYCTNNMEQINTDLGHQPDNLVELYMSNTEKVILELKQGRFNPQDYIKKGETFYQWEKWNLPHFAWPAQEKGIIDLEELKDSIRALKAKIDKKKSEKFKQKVYEAVDDVFDSKYKYYTIIASGGIILQVKPATSVGLWCLDSANVALRSINHATKGHMDDANKINSRKKLQNEWNQIRD